MAKYKYICIYIYMFISRYYQRGGQRLCCLQAFVISGFVCTLAFKFHCRFACVMFVVCVCGRVVVRCFTCSRCVVYGVVQFNASVPPMYVLPADCCGRSVRWIAQHPFLGKI